MEKLDYSDINKFLASLGVVLVGVSFLLPYFYLKEDFGLIIKMTDFNGLSPVVQDILLTKQYYFEKFQVIIPILSLLIITSGVISFYIGIKRWNTNQKQLDEKLRVDIEKTKREVLNMIPLTQKETEEKVKDEVQEEEKESSVTIQENKSHNQINFKDRINDYIRIEKTITDLFLRYGDNAFQISSQQKIDNRMNIDILLQSKELNISDTIVEIKYLQVLSMGLIRRILDTINTNTTYYKNKTGKLTIPLLIIVTKGKNTPEEISRFKDTLIKYKIGLPDIEEMFVEIIAEEDILNLDIIGIIREIKNRSQLQILHQHFLKLSK